jgi:hypothetical protein
VKTETEEEKAIEIEPPLTVEAEASDEQSVHNTSPSTEPTGALFFFL